MDGDHGGNMDRRKLRLILIGAALGLFLSSSAYSWGVVGLAGGGAEGFVGNEGTTAGEQNITASNYVVYSHYTVQTSGTVGYVHVVMRNAAVTNYNVAIYNADGSTKLAESNLKTIYAATQTQEDFTLDSTISVTASDTLIIGIGSSNNSNWYLDYVSGGAANIHYYGPCDPAFGDTMPSTIGTTGSFGTNGDIKIWADNSPN